MSDGPRTEIPAGGLRAWLSRLALLGVIGGVAIYALDVGPFAKLELSVLNAGSNELRDVDVRWRGGRIHTGRLAPGQRVAESIRAAEKTSLDLSFRSADGRLHEIPVDVLIEPGSVGRVQIPIKDGPRVSWSEDLKVR